MDLKWYYSAENNGTTDPVATLYKANGCPVLQVYKGKDAYFSRLCGEYACHIDKVEIPYEVVNNFVEEHCSDVPDNDKNKLKLRHASVLIQVDFDKQSDTILSLFS